MKKLLILLLSLLISFNSYGDWEFYGVNTNHTTSYINFEKIKNIDGYIYYWTLGDLLKPDKDGDFSYIGYYQGDCRFNKLMPLSEFYYKQPMGKGKVTTNTFQNPKWEYPPPDSMHANMLEKVCDYVK
jgi:hypothetical protein